MAFFRDGGICSFFMDVAYLDFLYPIRPLNQQICFTLYLIYSNKFVIFLFLVILKYIFRVIINQKINIRPININKKIIYIALRTIYKKKSLFNLYNLILFLLWKHKHLIILYYFTIYFFLGILNYYVNY